MSITCAIDRTVLHDSVMRVKNLILKTCIYLHSEVQMQSLKILWWRCCIRSSEMNLFRTLKDLEDSLVGAFLTSSKSFLM